MAHRIELVGEKICQPRPHLPQRGEFLVLLPAHLVWGHLGPHRADHHIAGGVLGGHEFDHINAIAEQSQNVGTQGVGQQVSPSLAENAITRHRTEGTRRGRRRQLPLQIVVTARRHHEQCGATSHPHGNGVVCGGVAGMECQHDVGTLAVAPDGSVIDTSLHEVNLRVDTELFGNARIALAGLRLHVDTDDLHLETPRRQQGMGGKREVRIAAAEIENAQWPRRGIQTRFTH